ncbi:MAG TPA: hypothetical protein VLD62_03760 [Acidimicrobiia bacterium]|nr:hypothetical protein [Acidimicrobiia bacterium]
MRRALGLAGAVLTVALVACGSGPNQEALDRNQIPTTTTPTEPPPEGIFVVVIENGKFTPSNLEFELDEFWIVRWENQDPPREYVITERRSNFESPTILPGETWEFDLRTLDDPATADKNEAQALWRYFTFIGNQRVPGIIDTRPAR